MTTTVTPKLVIHIGDPKTGTSSIQKALQTNVIACKTRRILPWENLNAIWVAKSLKPKGKANRAQQFGRVRSWLQDADADIAVLSAENFANAKPMSLLQALRKHVPDHAETARIVGYVRPHASRYLSAYIQRTKTGQYLGTFEDFFAHIRKEDPLAYTPRFSHWQDVFKGRFTLKPFVRSELRDGDIVADFAETILGDEPFSITRSVEENVAITLRALSGLRHVQIGLKEAGVDNAHRSWIGIALANSFLPSGPIEGDKPELDRNTITLLIDSYLDDAKALDAAFFSGPLMQTALTASLSKAIEHPIDVDVSQHFNSAERRELTSLSTELSKLYKDVAALWWLRHRSEHRNTALSSTQIAKIKAQASRLDGIDRLLQDISDILRSDGAKEV
jgi:hypothetical protein